MADDLLDLYDRASAWTVATLGAAKGRLDAPTPCDEWDVRTLLDHVLETQRYFLSSARGEDATPPGRTPPSTVSNDPAGDLERVRGEVIEAFGQPDVIEKTGPALGIAFSDMLLHGWDIARALGQDATMPEGLADAAYGVVHGKFTDEQRKGVFKPEIPVGADASPEERLLAYTGRSPV